MGDSYYDEVREYIAEYKKKQWELRNWTKRPALESKNGKEVCLYTGQKYNPKKFKLDPQGWDHDIVVFVSSQFQIATMSTVLTKLTPTPMETGYVQIVTYILYLITKTRKRTLNQF